MATENLSENRFWGQYYSKTINLQRDNKSEFFINVDKRSLVRYEQIDSCYLL